MATYRLGALAPPAAAGAVAVLLRVAWVGRGWLARYRQRRHLARLPDHLLRDMGLSRADVAAETAKPFWQA